MDTFFEKLKSPRFFQENRLAPHSDHVAFALQDKGTASSFRESLNGYWKFYYADHFAQVPEGFEKESYDTGSWNLIQVPGHIQLQGYDRPQYVNVQYPWDGREDLYPGDLPIAHNPIGNYVKYFIVPERMAGHRIFLSFQGVESAFRVWLNGQYIGFSSDTFTPSEFELTDYLKEGKNKLAVQVYKWYSGSWLEDQDFFRFSGIFRDVYLYATPKHHLRDLKIQAQVDPETFTHGSLQADLTFLEKGANVTAALYNPDGTLVKEQEFPGTEEHLQFAIPVEHPKLWSAETPFLYHLKITVSDPENGMEERIEQSAGFRHFSLDADHIMRLNGKRIVFKGVNRHEFSADHGRVVSDEELLKDLYTMKRNNINAIRLCHYPNSSRIYELADELGFYLIDECNMESHGSWDAYEKGIQPMDHVVPGDHLEYTEMLLDRIRSMVERDKNHPSILIWSCGNESFGGPVIHQMSQLLKSLDPSRLVHYEGIFHDRRFPDTSDMESQMYTPVAQIKEFLAQHRDKPFICCEYMHAMGNSCGALYKYTNLTEEDPLYQGGFIWDYIDQGLRLTDAYGKTYFGYGGDFDDRPNDGNFSGDGLVDCDRNPTPKMAEVKYCYQNIAVHFAEDQFTVENKHLFTDLNAFDCFLQLLENGKIIKEEWIPCQVAPLSAGTFALPFQVPDGSQEYVITISFRLKKDTRWAKAGHEVAFAQRIQEADASKETVQDPLQPRQTISSDFTLIQGNFNIGVNGKDFEVLFSKMAGGLISYRYHGKEMLLRTVKPNFWRAPTDNDRGCQLPFRCGQWKLASQYAGCNPMENPIVSQEEQVVTVIYRYDLPTIPQASCTLSYRVSADGRVETELSYLPPEDGKLPEMPAFSVLFPMKPEYQQMTWYGDGPEDCYADRWEGTKLGIYSRSVQENVTNYLKPQESGNHTHVRWMNVTDEEGIGLQFEAHKLEVSVSPWSSEELENAMHPNELPQTYCTYVGVGRQMGVGGDDSWGAATHPEFCIDSGVPQCIRFSFRGIDQNLK